MTDLRRRDQRADYQRKADAKFDRGESHADDLDPIRAELIARKKRRDAALDNLDHIMRQRPNGKYE